MHVGWRREMVVMVREGMEGLRRRKVIIRGEVVWKRRRRGRKRGMRIVIVGMRIRIVQRMQLRLQKRMVRGGERRI